MCNIGKTIKFCTCLDEQEIGLENSNYWVLYRYNEKKECHIIGEIMLLEYDLSLEKIRMSSYLLEAISDQSNFDTLLAFQERDWFRIVLNAQNKDAVYDFEYYHGVWLAMEEPNSISLVNNFEEVVYGNIEHK
ncbi:MAG: hypothetical protein ACPGSD_17500 [Flavobacteriales bacterium]